MQILNKKKIGKKNSLSYVNAIETPTTKLHITYT